MKHTPGPWKWSEDRWHGGYSGLFGSEDNPVIIPQHENDGDDGAAWFNTDGNAGEETLTEANALLIAAAPDMLAMLEELEYTRGCPCQICHQYQHQNHAADCKLDNLLKRIKESK